MSGTPPPTEHHHHYYYGAGPAGASPSHRDHIASAVGFGANDPRPPPRPRARKSGGAVRALTAPFRLVAAILGGLVALGFVILVLSWSFALADQDWVPAGMTPVLQDAVREVDKHAPLPLPLPPRNPDPDPATRYADAALSIASATTEGVDRVTHEAKDLGTTARDMYDRLKAARAAAHNASIYVADPDEPPQRAARTTVAIYDEWKDRIDTAIEDGTLARAEQGAIETAHQAAEVADAAAERAIEAAPHVNDALSRLFDFLLNALADRAPSNDKNHTGS